MSRTQSSVKNLITAVTGQVFGIIISFIARMIFLQYLSEDYLGLNGLFTNILTIFSLVELGVGPAMNFSLYKPLAENDIPKVKSLMSLYRKAYMVIGCAIALIGLAFTPFYTVFMDEVPNIPHLTAIYWLFTLNTVVSYFFSYKRALIICDEKRYIATIYRYVFYFLLNIVQIASLILTHNYILFLSIQVAFTFAENVCVSLKADKMYPFLKEPNTSPVSRDDKKEIKKNIGAMLMHKIGGMAVLSTDNIILSRFVSLTAVGLYSNYYLITDALGKITGQVFSSITASVGNLNAYEDEKSRQKLAVTFNRTFFINFWIYGFCSCCLWVLFNPFISLWLGSDLIFDNFTVLVIVVNFYLTGMRKSTQTFREATGAFYYDRFKPLAEAAINIIASVILAEQLGTAGVFLGTIISTLATCIWIEPYVLYKHIFKRSCGPYFIRLIAYTLVTILAAGLTYFISCLLSAGNALTDLIIKFAVCLVIPNAVFLLCFFRTDDFKYFVRLISDVVKKLFKTKK